MSLAASAGHPAAPLQVQARAPPPWRPRPGHGPMAREGRRAGRRSVSDPAVAPSARQCRGRSGPLRRQRGPWLSCPHLGESDLPRHRRQDSVHLAAPSLSRRVRGLATGSDGNKTGVPALTPPPPAAVSSCSPPPLATPTSQPCRSRRRSVSRQLPLVSVLGTSVR